MNPYKKIIYLFIFILTATSCSHNLHNQAAVRKASEKFLSKVETANVINASFTLSNNLRRVAYRLKENGKQLLVVDGIRKPLYDSVSIPVFSSDGSRVAYTGKTGSALNIIVDDKEEKSFSKGEEITGLHFSLDGKSIIYIIKEGNKVAIVNNGVKGKQYDAIDENSITFTPDGKKMGYTAGINQKKLIVFDGVESAAYEDAGFPILSPDGKRLAYWAQNNNKYFVVADNKKGKEYDGINSLIFNNDGSHFAYIAKTQEQNIVVSDEIESERYITAHSLMYSQQGSHLAYGMESTEKDKEGFNHHAVLDGKPSATFETVVEASLRFSPDGKHFAYEAEIHDMFFTVSDDKEGKYFGDIVQSTIVYSPNSARLSYAAEDNSMRTVTTDGKESEGYNDVFYITFSPDSKRVAYSALVNNKHMWDPLESTCRHASLSIL